MEKFKDFLDENLMLKVCLELGVKTRFINSIIRYMKRNKKCKNFVWITEEELMCIPGIGVEGARELKAVQLRMLCEEMM